MEINKFLILHSFEPGTAMSEKAKRDKRKREAEKRTKNCFGPEVHKYRSDRGKTETVESLTVPVSTRSDRYSSSYVPDTVTS